MTNQYGTCRINMVLTLCTHALVPFENKSQLEHSRATKYKILGVVELRAKHFRAAPDGSLC